MYNEDFIIELARLNREAVERVRNQMAARQLGELDPRARSIVEHKRAA